MFDFNKVPTLGSNLVYGVVLMGESKSFRQVVTQYVFGTARRARGHMS